MIDYERDKETLQNIKMILFTCVSLYDDALDYVKNGNTTSAEKLLHLSVGYLQLFTLDIMALIHDDTETKRKISKLRDVASDLIK